jgi:hypothetical protein
MCKRGCFLSVCVKGIVLYLVGSHRLWLEVTAMLILLYKCYCSNIAIQVFAGERNWCLDRIRDKVVVLEVKLRSCAHKHLYTTLDRLGIRWAYNPREPFKCIFAHDLHVTWPSMTCDPTPSIPVTCIAQVLTPIPSLQRTWWSVWICIRPRISWGIVVRVYIAHSRLDPNTTWSASVRYYLRIRPQGCSRLCPPFIWREF